MKIHFNIILSSTCGYSKRSLSLSSLHQSPVCPFHITHACHMPHPSHFGHPNNIWWRVQIKGLSMCSFFPVPLLAGTSFLNTLSLCSSLSLRNQASHPYKTTGKVTFLCDGCCQISELFHPYRVYIINIYIVSIKLAANVLAVHCSEIHASVFFGAWFSLMVI
jgi:hypothetical protein